MKTYSDEQIAQITYEANRAYCKTIGDNSNLPWDEAPDWQKTSTIAGVAAHRQDPHSTPRMSHEKWLTFKLNDGWKFGPVKDADKKEHPCILPYDDLPAEQKLKDYLFRDIVRTFINSPF